MSLDHFDPMLRSNDLVQDLKWDADLLHRFQDDPAGVLDDYDLLDVERQAILERDFKALYELGLHPYLLGQLARELYGTAEQAGTSVAATALVASLLECDPGETESATRARFG
jgi:hypothetical protein